MPLSESAQVSTVTAGSDWSITEGGNTFDATLDGTTLNIYAPSGFYATINWGESDLADTTVPLTSASNGLFAITASQEYTSIGSKTVIITVYDQYGNSQQVTSTVDVGNLYAGVQGTLTPGTFTDPNYSIGTTYTVSIQWGDGNNDTSDLTIEPTSPITVNNVAGVVSITANHTYNEDSIDQSGGVYLAQVTIQGSDGLNVTLTEPVEVTRPPSMLVVANIPQSGTVSSSQVLALFTDPDIDPDTADNNTAEFDASINWGDTTTGTGQVREVQNGSTNTGLYEVLAPSSGYKYANAVSAPLSVKVSQKWGVEWAMILQTATQMAMGDGPAVLPEVEPDVEWEELDLFEPMDRTSQTRWSQVASAVGKDL